MGLTSAGEELECTIQSTRRRQPWRWSGAFAACTRLTSVSYANAMNISWRWNHSSYRVTRRLHQRRIDRWKSLRPPRIEMALKWSISQRCGQLPNSMSWCIHHSHMMRRTDSPPRSAVTACRPQDTPKFTPSTSSNHHKSLWYALVHPWVLSG